MPKAGLTDHPRITLITATYNRAHMIGDMLASVALQAIPPTQHLVMDGGSSDGTVELLRGHPGIELHVEKDKGVYDAWNKARPLIRGDWVIYLNSDDLLPEGAFAAYAEALRERPEARMVTGQALLSDTEGRDHGRRTEPCAPRLTLANLRLRGGMINARLIRRDLIEAVGDLDLALHPASDLDLLIRIARRSPPAAYVAEPTYIYRKHEGSITLGRAAEGSMRAPRIGLQLLDGLLNTPGHSSAERANLMNWRRSYLQTLLSRIHWRADRCSFLNALGGSLHAAPVATSTYLLSRIASIRTSVTKKPVCKKTCYADISGTMLIVAGLLILITSASSIVFDFDERSLDKQTMKINQFLIEADSIRDETVDDKEFVRRISELYPKVHQWGKMPGPVSVFDNWILNIYAQLERINGVKIKERVYSRFRSHRYERAIGRGVGFCGYLSIAFSDLMQRRYGLRSSLITLSSPGNRGHIVSGIELSTGEQLVVDPSEGLLLPGSLRYLERNLDQVATLYRGRRLEHVAPLFGSEGNRVHSLEDVSGKIQRAEAWADWMRWIIPAVMLGAGAWLALSGRRARKLACR